MTDTSGLLNRYRRIREVRFRLNNLLVKAVSKTIMEECGRILGIFRDGIFIFETEEEASLLMDYCIYYPQSDGRNLLAKYLEKSPPPADSEELVVLQTMTHAYYSLFQVVEVKPGIGVSVRDLLRNETGFIIDVGFAKTAQPHMIVATRVVPMEDYLTTTGAALPVEASTARRIVKDLSGTKLSPETFDFHQITPVQEAELAAIVIRVCRSTGMTSRIAYADPGSPARPTSRASESRRIGRNDPCPCGSGKKFKVCCGRNKP